MQTYDVPFLKYKIKYLTVHYDYKPAGISDQ